jgi:DNA-binding response OmpR family regulator
MIKYGHVLIVEDEPILGFALEDMVLAMGASEVTLLSRLEEAEAFLSQATPDLAILDVNIHGKLSYGIADRLLDAQVPYFFATGYGDRTHPSQHTAMPTVTKPYSTRDIEQAIEAALKRARLNWGERQR